MSSSNVAESKTNEDTTTTELWLPGQKGNDLLLSFPFYLRTALDSTGLVMIDSRMLLYYLIQLIHLRLEMEIECFTRRCWNKGQIVKWLKSGAFITVS